MIHPKYYVFLTRLVLASDVHADELFTLFEHDQIVFSQLFSTRLIYMQSLVATIMRLLCDIFRIKNDFVCNRCPIRFISEFRRWYGFKDMRNQGEFALELHISHVRETIQIRTKASDSVTHSIVIFLL